MGESLLGEEADGIPGPLLWVFARLAADAMILAVEGHEELEVAERVDGGPGGDAAEDAPSVLIPG